MAQSEAMIDLSRDFDHRGGYIDYPGAKSEQNEFGLGIAHKDGRQTSFPYGNDLLLNSTG